MKRQSQQYIMISFVNIHIKICVFSITHILYVYYDKYTMFKNMYVFTYDDTLVISFSYYIFLCVL